MRGLRGIYSDKLYFEPLTLEDVMNIIDLERPDGVIVQFGAIFAAIFIPLTFIAGVYGTNFEYFPELHYRYSYFIFWAVLLLVALVMIRFFRRRGWL